ncbi:MAG: bifunctional 4-hydroxy-3-methylbut-2-enyl diphosphate reductase/30S ribosomal protein S1 [Ruminococcaceae bacterium]|nr:bifunctional 4-hydroxy-3-methylbut-2-enyl diphosphate reductase/30S ribosomal protein S1 [Oscillospiraceae bacterium]
MKIIRSEYAGFCFGVRRAVELLYRELDRGEKRIFTLGHLIHNDDFNREIAERGVKVIGEDELELVPKEDSVVFIRAHGAPMAVYRRLESRGIPYVDATCPYVKKIHNIVGKEERYFLIIGDAEHPEVKGIVGQVGAYPCTVCADDGELSEFIRGCDKNRGYGMLAQTTLDVSLWERCRSLAKDALPDIIIYDTICSATEQRQKDAARIAKQADVMLVIGGTDSSNTKKLAGVSQRYCPTYKILNALDLDKIAKFHPDSIVGLTAGASTPDRIIEEVINKMEETKNTEEMSFEELLNQSFKTLTSGEEVTGVITGIMPNEIHVDLGIKQTGILPVSEISDAEAADLQANFKVGDQVTVLVQKFNDAEGIVNLSKKRVDSKLGWKKVEEAYNEGAVITAKVVNAVKGGILVSYEGQNVFIPGSLTGLPKSAELSECVGNEVSFKIIELDAAKHRAVGSVRVVLREEKKAQVAKFWEEIEEGKEYTGTVKSLTSYGAFVDLGGVDGMIHITELSWKRLKHPNEVVNVGDTVTTFVKAVNKETKKISLGYKTEETNPWTILERDYNEGDVVKVKVVNFAPFGAFAEVVPGADGLIHISQIADRRIAKPEEVLEIGQEVEAQIIGLDFENKKISLSIRALLEDKEEVSEAAEEDAE